MVSGGSDNDGFTLITAPEAARRLGVSVPEVDWWIDQCILPLHDANGRTLDHVDDVEGM